MWSWIWFWKSYSDLSFRTSRRIQLIQPLLKRWNPPIIFAAKSPQDSPLLGRPSEIKVDVELELHSCTSSHDEVNFLLSILFCILTPDLGSHGFAGGQGERDGPGGFRRGRDHGKKTLFCQIRKIRNMQCILFVQHNQSNLTITSHLSGMMLVANSSAQRPEQAEFRRSRHKGAKSKI